ncbi:MAG: thiamine biosynthesis protein ThiF [Treponema sp.]|nr:thiamine biosynthesis protein ThiF [Treponema sp.]
MIPTFEEWQNALILKQGKEVQEKLSKSCVAICGAGGLGSNVALMLARAGIKKLILMDFDKVELTNLHRQHYKASQIGQAKAQALLENLKEIAPYVEYESHVVKITEENILPLVKDADLVCEAFDNPQAKAMLVNTILEKMPEKYLVAASGMAGFESANLIKTKKISRHFYLCGDNVSDINDGTGLIGSRVMLCAAHQAHAIIRILTGQSPE